MSIIGQFIAMGKHCIMYIHNSHWKKQFTSSLIIVYQRVNPLPCISLDCWTRYGFFNIIRRRVTWGQVYLCVSCIVFEKSVFRILSQCNRHNTVLCIIIHVLHCITITKSDYYCHTKTFKYMYMHVLTGWSTHQFTSTLYIRG